MSVGIIPVPVYNSYMPMSKNLDASVRYGYEQTIFVYVCVCEGGGR